MTTNKETKQGKYVILALYPNSLGLGYAVMENPLQVLRAEVIAVRPVCNRTALKRIKELLDYYQPKVIIVEDYKGIGSRKSNRISRLIDNISKYVKTQELELKSYSRSDIRYVFSQFNAHTKYEIACVLAENIEVMKDKLMDKRKTGESEKYTVGAFDAVSLGVTHFYMVK